MSVKTAAETYVKRSQVLRAKVFKSLVGYVPPLKFKQAPLHKKTYNALLEASGIMHDYLKHLNALSEGGAEVLWSKVGENRRKLASKYSAILEGRLKRYAITENELKGDFQRVGKDFGRIAKLVGKHPKLKGLHAETRREVIRSHLGRNK